MDRPNIDILLPCYNQAEYVGAAIEGALAQEKVNVYLYMMDDGSTDDSRKVMTKYNKYKNVYFAESNKNHGVATALNYLFSLGKSKHWTWISCDNVYHKSCFWFLYQHLIKSNCDIAYADFFIAQGDKLSQKQKISHPTPDRAMWGQYFLGICFLLTRKIQEKIGGWHHWRSGEDLDWQLRLQEADAKFYVVRRELGIYRYHDNSIQSRTGGKNVLMDHDAIVKRSLERIKDTSLCPIKTNRKVHLYNVAS